MPSSEHLLDKLGARPTPSRRKSYQMCNRRQMNGTSSNSAKLPSRGTRLAHYRTLAESALIGNGLSGLRFYARRLCQRTFDEADQRTALVPQRSRNLQHDIQRGLALATLDAPEVRPFDLGGVCQCLLR